MMKKTAKASSTLSADDIAAEHKAAKALRVGQVVQSTFQKGRKGKIVEITEGAEGKSPIVVYRKDNSNT